MDKALIWNQDAVETQDLLSLWDIVSHNREYAGNIQELEAATQMITSSPKTNCNRSSESPGETLIKVDLTGEENESSN